MKKKIISFILILLMLIGMIPFTLLTAFADGVSELVDQTPKISINVVPDAVHEYRKEAAKPDASGNAYFTIKADKELTESVTVYYETADINAIAASGDYEAKKASVTLTPEAPEAKIAIKTSRTEYAIVYTVASHRPYKTSYESRRFEVKITDVQGNGAEIDETKSRAECYLNSEYTLDAFWASTGSLSILFPYSITKEYALYGVLNTPAWSDNDSNYVTSIPVNFPSDWSAYVNSGIDAKLYMALQDAHIDESSYNSSSDVIVNLAGVSVTMQGEFHNNEWFGWGSAFTFKDTGNIGNNGEHKESYFDNFKSVLWTAHDGKRVKAVFRDDVSHDYQVSFSQMLDKKYVIIRDSKRSKLSQGAPNPNNYYISLGDDVLNLNSLSLEFDIFGGYSRRLSEGDIIFRLEDISAPVMEKDGNAYAVYHNFDTVTVGEKLRLAIRFNEPVQISGKDPYITGKVNGRGTGVQTDPYFIRFDYAGGAGTDTLYFEGEYNGNYNITSITDMTFSSDSKIVDYADVANQFVPQKFSVSGFSLDRRFPVINVNNTDFNTSTNPIKSASLEVSVGQVSEGAILSYAWTDNANTPTSYDNEKVLDNISINENQVVTITGGGNGKKFLHLKAESRFGKSTINIYNSVTAYVKEYLGPFYFDNTAPSFNTAVEPVVALSDTLKKVYKIPLPSDLPADSASGFQDLKIYYQLPGEEVKLLEREKILSPHGKRGYDLDSIIADDFKLVENGKSYLTFEIEAVDLGIGDMKRVEGITISFVLRDKIGNESGNTFSHKITFDTNTYVEVVTAGPTQDFAGQDVTEVLDGGSSLIYKNNKVVEKSETEKIYYAFDIQIKKSANTARNEIIVVKNADKSEDSVVLTEGFTVSTRAGDSAEEEILTVEFTAPIATGSYDLYVACFEDDNLTDLPDRVSPTYRVYVGEGIGKLGNEISKGTLLINKVYQLPSSTVFCYMSRPEGQDNPNYINTVFTELYNSEKLPMSFSSSTEAEKFVLFNEYRDLYAVTLTNELADALNTKTGGIHPAQGEITEARAGQVWIRYKSMSWTLGNTQATNWVYYYYGNSELLNPDNFSTNLKDALGYVASIISKTGSTVSLTDLSLRSGTGATLVDKNGVPYLAPSQIVTSDIHLSDSATPIGAFSKDIVYSADTAIYSSTVVKSDMTTMREFFNVGNVLIPTASRFQIRRYNSIGSGYISDNWAELASVATDLNGKRFADVIPETGWYEIRELGINGVYCYDIYIDKDSPIVQVSWRDKDGNTLTQWINSSSVKEFRAKNFEISAIDEQEADKYSYVAIYNSTKSELVGVYTMTELKKSTVQVSDGKYYMVIADRSGNSYSLDLHINSSELNCDIKETSNVKIVFTCERDVSHIQTFYVKLNGVRIENLQYQNTLTFTESGTYEFYVEDIYGNVYSPKPYDFIRSYPKVDWSYLAPDGYFKKYEEGSKPGCVDITKVMDDTYSIKSSVQLRFQFAGDYVYEFIGIAPETTKNDIYNYVTINSTQNFQLKVYYRSHPDVYTIYNCSADRTVPSIKVSAQVDVSTPKEIELMKEAIANGESIGIAGSIIENGIAVSGSFLKPTSIAYFTGKTQTKYLVDGETILSDFIKVNVTDESGVSSVTVYLNGEVINTLTADEGISELILSRFGEYRIVAEDILGNKAEFGFNNKNPDSFGYFIDGLQYELGLHDYKDFDSNLNFTEINYGKDTVKFTVYENMMVFYMLTDLNGERKFVAFDVQGGVVREVYYFLRDGDSTPELTVGNILFDSRALNNSSSKSQLVFESDGILILASVDSNGNIVLTTQRRVDGTVTVEARINTVDGEFYYNKTELSSDSADLILKTEDKILSGIVAGEQTNINKPFEIITDNFAFAKVVSVKVYYSLFNDLDADNLSERKDIYGQQVYSDEGFYLIAVKNQYGNESIYRVHISDDFEVTSYVEFSDGEKIHYTSAYRETLYSDSKIVFEVHANYSTVIIKKDGVAYKASISVIDGVTCITLNENGSYTLNFSDSYGNSLVRSAIINTARISFNENLLSGYNENALKKDEGYTNQKLSVVADVINSDAIYYLAILYGDSLNVIYDSFSESTVNLDVNKFYECIGNSGDGEYTVFVRNRYGASASKVIHYRGTPTLKLERETRSDVKSQPYSLADAVSIGFWSNNKLTFITDASLYEFTVNGDKTECPKSLFFESSDLYGRNEYNITYIDEYGFSYSFKAYLVRQELAISVSPSLKTENINNVISTKDNVSVDFSENAFCIYTLDNSEEIPYTSGEQLTKDGVYRFLVYDYAGNMTALTVKKDTVVEFYFKSNSSSSLANGEVVNYSKVEFNSKKEDTAYIESVIKNGVLQKDFTGTSFSEDGKWEVIIADKLGNKAYFSFYIVSHAQNGFSYTTPYEYRITDLWYDTGDGVKVSYMSFVTHDEFTSSFSFRENGNYTVLMESTLTGATSTFEFTINTEAPVVSLLGCEVGETTINDVTITGCKIGDRIKIYKSTNMGETLVTELEVSSAATQIPTITEGGEYRVVVESEAGVATEMNFVRKHVMNTSGSVFVMVIVGVCVVMLFAGLVYRNKSKTDD